MSSMRPFLACFLLLFQLLPCALRQACASSVAYPVLSPGSLYAAEEQGKKGKSSVELFLLNRNFFVLRQEHGRRDKEKVRDVTGIWRQVEDGAVLLLTNRYGLEQKLSIGGGHNLYGDFRISASDGGHDLVLREKPFTLPSFTVMGRLEMGPKGACLTDSASGRVFTPVEGKALQGLPADRPLFVEVQLTPSTEGGTITSVRSYSEHFPTAATLVRDPDDFARASRGIWSLPSMSGMPRGACTFVTGDGQSGKVEIAGPGLWLMPGFRFHGTSLSFSVSRDDLAMLKTLGAESLVEMLRATAWSLEGDELVLTTGSGQNFVLSKSGVLRHDGDESRIERKR